MDALAPRRGSSGGENGVSERVVNQLLTEVWHDMLSMIRHAHTL